MFVRVLPGRHSWENLCEECGPGVHLWGYKGRGQLKRVEVSLQNSPKEWEKRRPTPGMEWNVLQQLSKEESKCVWFLELITRKEKSVRTLSSYQPKVAPLSPGHPNKCGLSSPATNPAHTSPSGHTWLPRKPVLSGGSPHPTRWVFQLSCGTFRMGDPSWPGSSLREPHLKPGQI